VVAGDRAREGKKNKMDREIISLLESLEPGDVCGLRADDESYDLGDRVMESRRWEDNEVVEGEYLYGASTLAVRAATVPETIRALAQYEGCHIYLIAGREWMRGEDAGELLIKDGTVIGRWSR
jgi:hypothetical protein